MQILWSKTLSALLLVLPSIPLVESKFEPYEVNGGLVSAVAGKGFCVIASDTRMSGSGYLLHSRNHISSRLWTISDDDPIMSIMESKLLSSGTSKDEVSSDIEAECILPEAPVLIGSSGCTADCRALQLDMRADLRAASHFGQACLRKPHQIATSLSQMLYSRRGFPYYAFCVVAALDGKEGHVYVYDAIGSYEQVAVATSGTGRDALQPILDRAFLTLKESPRQVEGSADEVIYKLTKAYRSVSEREIEVGDKLVLHVSENVPNGGVKCRVVVVPLKED